MTSPTEAIASCPNVPTITVSAIDTRLTRKDSRIEGQATLASRPTVSEAVGRSVEDLYCVLRSNRAGSNIRSNAASIRTCLLYTSGAQCRDFDGKTYIDFGSGIGVNSLGFCDPAWAQAVAEQARTLSHCSNYFATEPSVLLAQEVCRRTGMSKVFFANSGAEANEGAIKAARKYASQKGKAGGKIVTLVNSFHGRTMTTLTATGQKEMHVDFDPFMPGFDYAQAGNLEDTLQKLDGAVAVMMEMIQGEGGVNMLEKEYVTAVADYCHAHDILIIDDEVQTGAGRTGAFLCCEHYGLHPDIVTMAKGLGGGLPIGAVLLSEKVQGVFSPGSHGSTFGGNPIVLSLIHI